jgi:hypothetical protein
MGFTSIHEFILGIHCQRMNMTAAIRWAFPSASIAHVHNTQARYHRFSLVDVEWLTYRSPDASPFHPAARSSVVSVFHLRNAGDPVKGIEEALRERLQATSVVRGFQNVTGGLPNAYCG